MRLRLNNFFKKFREKSAARPRVLLLADTRNWAFDAAAKGVQQHLSDEFDFRIEYVCERPDLSRWPFELVYVFWWGETYHEKFVRDSRRVIKEISSHRWALEEQYGRITAGQLVEQYLKNAKTLTATSRRLQAQLCAYREVFHTPNGFDPAHFFCKGPRQGPLRIGWAGNAEDACKGLKDILNPAADGQFQLHVAGGKLSRAEMLDFYNGIDVLCVASTAEGEPLTLIEGMACGCFPVCVDVGIVSELVRPGANGLVIERSAQAFQNAFAWCAENISYIRKAGLENAEQMKRTRTWESTGWYWRAALRRALQIAHNSENRLPRAVTPGPTRKYAAVKPRVLLVADVPDWIFARHCMMLQKLLGHEFELTVQYEGQAIDEAAFDLIYPLQFNLVPFSQITRPQRWVTGIRSHISWHHKVFPELIKGLSQKFQAVHVVSRRLLNIFKPLLPSVQYVTHGVDTAFFTPRTHADQSGRKLRLGWAGSRKKQDKGFVDFVTPLGKVPGVELVHCGHMDTNLGLDQMPAFYDSLDAYICTSTNTEGNNNSLLEAASMCRAIVTTDNGTVPEYLVHGESALIVERSLPAFTDALLQLRDAPDLRVNLGAKARQAVRAHFEWSRRAEDYRAFFWGALAASSQEKQELVEALR